MRFIHASDLHIDSPLHGLDSYDGAPVERLRSASRHALIARRSPAPSTLSSVTHLASECLDELVDLRISWSRVGQLSHDLGLPMAAD